MTPPPTPPSLFARLGHMCSRRRVIVIAFWIGLIAAIGPFAPRIGEELTPGGFEIAGSASDRARSVILDRFPRESPTTLTPVLTAQPGKTPTPDQFEQVARRIETNLRTVPIVRDVGPLQLSEDATSGVILVGLTANIDESLRSADALIARVQEATSPQVAVSVTGGPAIFSDFDTVNEEDLRRAEIVQAPLLAIVLLLVLGSLLAASLPIVTTVAALLVTLGGLYFAAKAVTLSIYVKNIVPLIGIGVGVDYSLFLVKRFREERERGRSVHDAVVSATATSGRAIFYSGLTVVVALAGMFVVGVPIFTGFAVGTIAFVMVAVAASLTLIPAVLATFGDRTLRWDVVRWLGGRRLRGRRRDRWNEWAERVMNRPWRYAIGASLLLLVLAVPTLWITLGSSGATALPPDAPSIRAADVVAKQLGPGGLGPHRIVIDGGDSAPPMSGVTALRKRLADDPDIASVGPIIPSKDGNAVLFDAVSRYGEDDRRSQATVPRINDRYVPLTRELASAQVLVGGGPAQNRDFNRTIADNTPRVVALVMLLTFLVLVVLFRSVVLPLKAVVMTLISALSAYGVLVMVFQWGWGDHLLGFEHLGHVSAWVPPFLFSILFGLSMDYEVFLLTRVREHFDAYGDDRAAVAWGLAHSGAIITAAASIMVIVFFSFLGNRLVPLKELSLGLGIAVLLDATVVRVMLVPAFMRIAGRWNWWLPGWLDRILPKPHSGGTLQSRPEGAD